MIHPCYFELRTAPKHGKVNLAADMMRHLHARQYLGKTTIICENPATLLPDAYKQWLKLSRTIQQWRLQTTDADKILKYTHTITHMQHVQFTDKIPLENPEADVHFLRSEQLQTLPAWCYTVYTETTPTHDVAVSILEQLPTDALVVNYSHATTWSQLGCAPKNILDAQVATTWEKARAFFAAHQLDVDTLFDDGFRRVDVMDNTLDTLLAHSHAFLQVASDFQRAFELARPLKLNRVIRYRYDMLILLAHRVQALSSNSFTQRFLETYNEDDTFFLYDAGRKRYHPAAPSGESLAEAVARHRAAGRLHLARALAQTAQTKPAPQSTFVTS